MDGLLTIDLDSSFKLAEFVEFALEMVVGCFKFLRCEEVVLFDYVFREIGESCDREKPC